MTLITENGPLDLCFTPDGLPDGFSTLSVHATVVELPPLEARLRDR
jgi:hypothetical protein